MKVRVPGKALLSGEYAVLDGGTAVLAPVPRFLTVTRGEPGDDSPVVRAARDIPIPGVPEDHGVPFHIDRSEFLHTRPDGTTTKLGIGGSAAEAVGVIALRMKEAGQDATADPDHLFHLAHTAHHEAQGGMGSGADVAACAYGRWIRYRLEGGEPRVEPIARPALPLSLTFCGESADTRIAVARFDAWREAEGAHAETVVDELVTRSGTLAELWSEGARDRLISGLREYVALLDTIAEQAGFAFRTPAVRRIEAAAEAEGGYAKPTGAGGGDMVLRIGDVPAGDPAPIPI